MIYVLTVSNPSPPVNFLMSSNQMFILTLHQNSFIRSPTTTVMLSLSCCPSSFDLTATFGRVNHSLLLEIFSLDSKILHFFDVPPYLTVLSSSVFLAGSFSIPDIGTTQGPVTDSHLFPIYTQLLISASLNTGSKSHLCVEDSQPYISSPDLFLEL